jgi:HSP20 family protein
MSSENAITTTNANEIDVQRQQAGGEIEMSNSRPANNGWTYRPDADIYENAGEFVITLDVPGVAPESVDLTVDRGVLIVHGRVAQRRAMNHRQWMRQEYGVGDYYRRFQLDESINLDAIDAVCENGVLRITLPRHEAARPHRITVGGGTGKAT